MTKALRRALRRIALCLSLAWLALAVAARSCAVLPGRESATDRIGAVETRSVFAGASEKGRRECYDKPSTL
jgi:hypothetical protein